MVQVDLSVFQKLIEVFVFKANSQKPGHVLQGAITIRGAMFTIHVVNRKHQLQGCFLKLPDTGRVGSYNHVMVNPQRTCRNRAIFTFNGPGL